jgi:hypothetical protein
MKDYFHFVTDPESHGNEKFYFDFVYRQEEICNLRFLDNHDFICEQYGLDRSKTNWYTYNYFNKEFYENLKRSIIDDRVQSEAWAREVDHEKITGPFCLRIFFPRMPRKWFYIALKLINQNKINYSIVSNPYPLDDSQNYFVTFSNEQTDYYYLFFTLLFDRISSAIKYHVYGFDIFNIIRVCDRNEKRRHCYSNWAQPKKEAFDNAINKLLNYYEVSDKFDMYPYLIRDIVKKHNIPWGRIGYSSSEQVRTEKERKIILKQIEHEMIMNYELPSRWKSEQEMFRIIKREFSDAIFHCLSLQWLEPQHLDVYIPSKNCAFEYQGGQHFTKVDFFGGEKAYSKRIKLDKRKRELCRLNGVRLIEWHYSEPLTHAVLMRKLANSE